MSDFFQTRMGQQFYCGDVPAIAEALRGINRNLGRIADALEAQANKGAKNADSGEVLTETDEA